jgi:hypothetical protein
VQGLNAAGYDGCYEVELMGEEIEALDNYDLLARSRKTFSEWMQGSKKPEFRGQRSEVRV